jgi:hypothetical protein
VDLDPVSLEVDQPGFGNPGTGVEGQFDLPVIIEGGLRHLDHQQDVLGPRVGGGVEIGMGFE